MKYLFTGLLVCVLSIALQAQNSLKAVITAGEEKTALPCATLTWKEGAKSAVADSAGLIVMDGLPNGAHTFVLSHVGFAEITIRLSFPLANNDSIPFELEEAEEEEEEVIVTTTRTSRTIANEPTRMEIISGEELAEKANMKPGDIRMMLTESTGIQTQQTSATSFNAGIRIQGLDGRYTQILRDGYPLYAGFSGGLSILQIAPLDLRQVEVIKGSASTLYGGGAIAGLVNLVSKTPGGKKELSFLANGTSAGGLDLSGFYSERYGKIGLTAFASRNSNAPFDPAGIGLTAIPKFERYTINPRIFFYGKNTTADVGIGYITEQRTGGSMAYIKTGSEGFFEKNNTDRITAQAGVVHQLNEKSTLQLKNSYSRFNRSIAIPAYNFKALQQSSFAELTWNYSGKKSDWIAGANVLTDALQENAQSTAVLRDYRYTTFGLFTQNTWPVNENLTVETGLRGDYTKQYGFALLPRLSALLKLSPKLTTRLGGGVGYKTPTIFTEESERIQFQNIFPIDETRTQYERSAGGNWDVNYRTRFGDVGFSINQFFFYTRLNKPLVLVGAPGGKLAFQNAAGHFDTRGIETNVKLLYGNFKLFVGYTFTDAYTHFTSQKEWLPLTARHRLNNVLMYEVEEKLKLGLEAYYFSRQRLNDGSFGKPYWITGFMAERLWEKFSVYINFENFTDTRQTRFDNIYTGSLIMPQFKDIYAPVEGFVVNGGVKVRL